VSLSPGEVATRSPAGSGSGSRRRRLRVLIGRRRLTGQRNVAQSISEYSVVAYSVERGETHNN